MQTMAEHARALPGISAYAPPRDARWHRQAVLAGVVLGHGLLVGLLAYLANQHLARDWPPSASHATAPLATTVRLVVQLLPLASGAVPRAVDVERAARTAGAAATTALRFPQSDAGVAQTPTASSAVVVVPEPATPTPGVQLDVQTLRRALDDAEAGTVRTLAKRAGRLNEVERLRGDPLAPAMAGAATSALREGAQARVAEDAKCKQELGKSGVGEKSRDNDRDTFMSTYIGAGKDCRQ